MIPVAILFFLVGAVLAWGFRVWVLLPISLLVMMAAMLLKLVQGAGLLIAVGYGVLLVPVPQLGYAFVLLARNALLVLGSARTVSVANLYKRHSIERTG
jgi:hypothetical protein